MNTYNPWHNATKKDSLQGLVYDETTGENIAVTYEPETAQLVSAAPSLLAACKLARDSIVGLLPGIDTESTIVLPALREAIQKAEG